MSGRPDRNLSSLYAAAPSCILHQDGDALTRLINEAFPSLCQVVFKSSDRSPFIFTWRVNSPSGFLFELQPIGSFEGARIFADRWLSLLDLFAACQTSGIASGVVDVNLEDYSHEGLRFCDTELSDFLIPDSDFMSSRGYEAYKATIEMKPWSERLDIALWRGSSTGYRHNKSVYDLPRIKLCLLARNSLLLDCGITSFVQMSDEEISDLSLLKIHSSFIDSGRYADFRYHIDIDGNSTAWSALFCKFLSGGLVFKICSQDGYKQWYYDRLVAWKHFVPVKSDLSDLLENLEQIRLQPLLAQEIAACGRQLALSIDYKSQLELARNRALSALRRGRKMLKDNTCVRITTTSDQEAFGYCCGDQWFLIAHGSGLDGEITPVDAGAVLHWRYLDSNEKLALRVVTRSGSSNSSVLATLVLNAVERGSKEDGKLSKRTLTMDGMSGRCYRYAINNLVASIPNARYLEVGSWAGSTSCAAMEGNRARVVCIDNWSEFGGPKEEFLKNASELRGPYVDFDFIEDDFRNVSFTDIGRFNVYLFDGPHAEKDQYDGVAMALPALDDRFVFIVDDWNWDYVRRGTSAAIKANGLVTEFSVEIRTTLDNSHPEICRQHSDWHNGYFIGVLSKS